MSEERKMGTASATGDAPIGEAERERVHLPVVCRKLRTKTAFGTLEGLTRDWREGASSTAVYWCLRTMETWGTDQRPAHATACREGRGCFAAPDGTPPRPA